MEARVISKVSRRIVPFVALCYFVCYLDRVNVGFAALQMNGDLDFTATMFGWGAGIFFFGYFFFEVPSNLALERFGARLWIARIMVTWAPVVGRHGADLRRSQLPGGPLSCQARPRPATLLESFCS